MYDEPQRTLVGILCTTLFSASLPILFILSGRREVVTAVVLIRQNKSYVHLNRLHSLPNYIFYIYHFHLLQ
jgi:hypothetical protein